MLSTSTAAKILEAGKSTGASYVEIFVENTHRSSLSLLSSEIDSSQSGIDSGVGIRLLFHDQVTYLHSNTLVESALIDLIYRQKSRIQEPAYLSSFSQKTIYSHARSPKIIGLDRDISSEEKIYLLKTIDQYARACTKNDKISQVYATIAQSRQKVQIFASDGTCTEDERNYIRMLYKVIASDGAKHSMGYEAPGAQAGWEFTSSIDHRELAEKVTRRALRKLEAAPCPAGKLPIVIDNGFGGVIFHEACGHSLETTAVAKRASVFTDKIGQKIAHSCLNAVDDGTLEGEWGSSKVDDEGMPTQRTPLIKDGILQSYMVDLVGSLQTGYARTGSGRRQSYTFAPASRMRNTLIESGEHTLEELISSIHFGIYAHKMGGGSVIPGTGEFNFAVNEAYIIRDGKVAELVRSALLIGKGEEVLKSISMVANNFERAQGMCGSVSGWIPNTVGQPAIKVDEILVGGDSL